MSDQRFGSGQRFGSETARGTRTGSVLTHTVLVMGAVAMIGPFVWQLLTAFKSLPETTTVPPTV